MKFPIIIHSRITKYVTFTSKYHLSVSLHFTECLSYFDTLNVNFKIIALSETAFNSHHTMFRMPNYNIEMNHRVMKRGGGTSVYIHKSLQYKAQKELQIVTLCSSRF